MSSSTDRIEKQIHLKAPVDRVWRALTDHKEFGTWFGVALEKPFAVNEKAKGRITHQGYEDKLMELTVKAIEPPRRFVFTWNPYAVDDEIDYSKETPTTVEFLLEAAPGGTRLKVTESGFDQVPAARRAEAFRMNEHGWAAQLTNIERHVLKAA